MIGRLPKTLTVNGIDRKIRSDYRVALLIFVALDDPELIENDKLATMIECLYEDEISQADYEEAATQASWFLDGGKAHERIKQSKKVLDWEQDEQIIFSAVNKVAGKEVREQEYMHWWTFLSYFNEIGDGILSSVINIRGKKNKGKKLDKSEEEFYRANKELCDLKTKYTAEEQADIDRLNELFS